MNTVLALITICSLVYSTVAFGSGSRVNLCRERRAYVLAKSEGKEYGIGLRRAVGSCLISSSLLLGNGPSGESSTALATGSGAELVDSVLRLEAASTRGDAIQALADVFEAAGSKTILARTKLKYRIVQAVNDKHVKLANEWDKALSYESGEVKRRVDPFRTVDLGPYLKIAPFIGGTIYVGLILVQKFIPEIFAFAYPLGVFVFVAPILFTLVFT